MLIFELGNSCFKKEKAMNRQRRSAFTLLEILLVVAILVVLAAVAVPNLIKFFNKGKVGTAETAVKSAIPSALKFFAMESYPNTVNGYPTTEQGLGALVDPPDGVDESKKSNWPYLENGKQGLTDPWGNPYQYKCPGEHNTDSYDLWSFGPDGPNGKEEDDVINWSKDEAK
jgi:general secretion pathway protein G